MQATESEGGYDEVGVIWDAAGRLLGELWIDAGSYLLLGRVVD